jgi:hypothetical protein
LASGHHPTSERIKAYLHTNHKTRRCVIHTLARKHRRQLKNATGGKKP